MGQIFNVNVIQSILDVEEKMFNSIKKISKYHDFSDVNNYDKEIEKLKIYYKKENFLISKIPNDIDFYNYLFQFLQESSSGLNDENIVMSRFRNILYNNYLNLKPNDDVSLFDEEDYYDDQLFGLKVKLFMRDNLLVEYLKSFDVPMRNSNEKSFNFFNKIRLYNIFLNKHLFDNWIHNDFDVDNIYFYSNEEAMKYLNLSKEDYYYFLNETVAESCENMLTCVFSDVKRPKLNITVQDSFFNFKFLLKKLSTESVQAIKKEMNNVYSSVGNYSLLSDIIVCLDDELNNRIVPIKDSENNNYIDSFLFDKIINLVKLENDIYDLFDSIDFNSSLNNLSKLKNYIVLEKELLKDIYVSSSFITIFNDLFNNSMWIYLTGDINEKWYNISQRLTNLIPFYRDIKVSPSQSMDSYNFIYKNHLVRSLKNFCESINEFNDDKIKENLEKRYKFYYFINPELTDELLAVDGNHALIFDLSSDLSGLDDLEYYYDQDELLYNLGCDIISYIFDNEDKINSLIDYSEFQFKLNELIDIIDNLSSSYNKKLYKYLMSYSSFFSPLRRDMRKIFKDNFNVKSINN